MMGKYQKFILAHDANMMNSYSVSELVYIVSSRISVIEQGVPEGCNDHMRNYSLSFLNPCNTHM